MIFTLVRTDLKNVVFQASDTNVIPGDGKHFNQLMGVLPRDFNSLRFAPIKKSVEDESNEALPENFDARERWPECSSLLSSIKDQSNCGSILLSVQLSWKVTPLRISRDYCINLQS